MSNGDDYKELASEVNNLRQDLAKSAGASKFMANYTKEAIEEGKRRRDDLDKKIREMDKEFTLYKHRLDKLEEKDKEHTGKIRTFELEEAKGEKQVELAKNNTELKKGQWALYSAIGVAIITGVVNLLLHFFGS